MLLKLILRGDIVSLTGFQRRRRDLEENINKDLEVNYEELKVTELKELAKEKDIEGFEDMKKAELIEALTK